MLGGSACTGNTRSETLRRLHCKEDSNYVFPEIKLRGLRPNFHIHVSVSDLYIPTIGPPIFQQQNRQTDRGNILIADRYSINISRNWD